MSNDHQDAESTNEPSPSPQGPDWRSRVYQDKDLEGLTKYPEIYKKGQYPIFVKGARGVDPNPYTICAVLDNGQYYLERNGRWDGKVYKQRQLQTEPEASGRG